MIEARGVALAYGGRAFLTGVSLEVRAGELLALVGPNGAGKTSLLRAFAGLLPAAEGAIAVDGTPVERLSARERGRRIAVVEADGAPPEGMTVRELVANGRLPYRAWWQWSGTPGDDAIVEEALERTALVPFADRPFGELSSGEGQRAWIAVALAQRAATVLLDEPTSHLDVRHAFEALELMRTLAHGGRAAAVVLHDLNLAAAFADRIALLGEGALLAYGRPGEALRADVLSRAYGVEIDVRTLDGELTVVPRRQRSA